MFKRSMLILLSLLMCCGIFACAKPDSETSTDAPEVSGSFTATDKDTSADSTSEDKTSTETTDTSKETTDMTKYIAEIKVKDYGTITLLLDPSYAPITVANFVKLAESGFYNGLTFHRIIKGFMIQGGDPLGNGMGGSEESIKGEFLANGVNNTLSHKRGVISMARSQMPNSASSQFFICDADDTFLDGNYAAFGWVTDGMDVVDKIAADARPVDGNGTIPKSAQPVIETITVRPEGE